MQIAIGFLFAFVLRHIALDLRSSIHHLNAVSAVFPAVNVQIYRGLLDTSASENAARMSAMDNATRNCDEMVGALTLLFNKTRQTSITNELIDIVGGAEALK